MGKEGDVDVQKLPCQLTADERELKTQELVRLEQDEAKQKAAKKAAVAVMNGDLKSVRAQIEERVKELAEGTEVREVQVKAVYRYQEKQVDYVRVDTGAVVQSRPMDAYDLQEELPGADPLPPPSQPQKRTRKKKHGELNDVPDQTA